ncbi:MAG: arylsulfatase A-like enzyme [Limisphaerales bacterium]|jgi:arylsulfatase A-like enzyme
MTRIVKTTEYTEGTERNSFLIAKMPLRGRLLLRRFMKRLGLLLLPCLPCIPWLYNSVAAQPTNVVVLLADDQGWGDMSLHGNTRVETPNIDGLFRESLQLKNFMVWPVCSPTRAGFLTGRHPLRLGAGPNVGGELDVAETTIGDFFQGQGYRTGVFGKWHNGMEPDTPEFRAAFKKAFKHIPDKPYDTGVGANAHGFDRAVVYYGGGPDKWTRMAYGNQLISWFHDRDYRPEEKGYLADLITRNALEFIREGARSKKPFFCYVPFDLVHMPLQAKQEFLARAPDRITHRGERLHSAMLLALDESVGKILGAIDDAGIRENTIVWYFSDNGGLKMGSSLPFRGGKHTTWEGGVHVPAAIRWPKGGFNGGEYAGLLGYLDVMPTLAGILGKPLKTARPLDGVDCSTALKSGGSSPVKDYYWAWRDNEVIRTDRWKMFHYINRLDLYDMHADPTESVDVDDKYGGELSGLMIRMEKLRKGLRIASPLNSTMEDHRPAPEGDVLELTVTQNSSVAITNALAVQFAIRRHRVAVGDSYQYDIMIPEGDLRRGGCYVSPYRNGDPPVFNDRVGMDQDGVNVAGPLDAHLNPAFTPGKWRRHVMGLGHEAPLLRTYNGVFFYGGEPGRFKVYIDNVRILRANGTSKPVWLGQDDLQLKRPKLPPGFEKLTVRTVSLDDI